MKLILCICLSIAFIAAKSQISVNTNDSKGRWICFFNCTGSYSEISNGCKKATLSSLDKIDSATNPYVIFDGLVEDLEKESGSNVYNISYSFQSCDLVCNAAAMMNAEGQQIVYYNPQFMNEIALPGLDRQWAVKCIFAHEIGHHILKHSSLNYSTLGPVDKQRAELRADFFSGFLINRAKGTLHDALQGLLTLDAASYKPSNSEEEKVSDYPTLERRKIAVTAGYNSASDSQVTVDMLADIKKFALSKPGLSILFRVTDKAFKNGDLDLLKNSMHDYLIKQGFSEDEILNNSSKLNDLKKDVNDKLDIKATIKVKNDQLIIAVKPEDIQKVKALDLTKKNQRIN